MRKCWGVVGGVCGVGANVNFASGVIDALMNGDAQKLTCGVERADTQAAFYPFANKFNTQKREGLGEFVGANFTDVVAHARAIGRVGRRVGGCDAVGA